MRKVRRTIASKRPCHSYEYVAKACGELDVATRSVGERHRTTSVSIAISPGTPPELSDSSPACWASDSCW